MKDLWSHEKVRGVSARAPICKILLTGLLAIHLIACGGGGGGTGTSDGGGDVVSDIQINGSVGDGPIVGARIVVYSVNGNELGTMTSDKTASFQFSVKAKGRDFPLLIKAKGGTDLVTGAAPSFTMLSVMLSPSDKQQNINPFTTLIVKTAQSLSGGLNSNNVKAARVTIINKLGFGLDAKLIPDPITTRIDTTRAANLIKASECLAEMVRRTASVLRRVGTSVTDDGVLTALAADLSDGYLDGHGASGVNARISVVAEVVSAQVLVEALRNELKVEGVIATGILDQAIRTTQPGISGAQLTASVRITAGMLAQVKVALAAAKVLDSSSAVAGIVSSVELIAPNSLASAVKQVLPASAPTYLNNAVTLSSKATTQQISSIGQIVNGGRVSSGDTSGSTVTVQPGSMFLQWTAPVSRTDGTPLLLRHIDGFRIYYGPSTGNYSHRVDIGDGSAQSATVTNLAAGTYSVVMTTYDINGLESGHSAPVTKTVK